MKKSWNQAVESATSACPPDAADLALILDGCGRRRSDLIAILQAIQARYHYLPEAALRYVCAHTAITPADMAGVSTFYTQFRHRPAGRHTINVCVGTACHVKGARRVTEAFRRHLKLADGADTDSEHLFTVQEVNCLGCCTLAPAVQVDDVIYGYVTPDAVGDVIERFLAREREAGADAGLDEAALAPVQGEIRLGMGSCCLASGAADVERALRDALRRSRAPVRVRRVGCLGMCHTEPLLEIACPGQPPTFYPEVKPDQVPAILATHFPASRLTGRLKQTFGCWLERLYTDEAWSRVQRFGVNVRDPQIAAYRDPQRHLATEGSGTLDPASLPAYRSARGFEVLRSVLYDRPPSAVIDQIKASGLRGRGGGGFPTGRKWDEVARMQAASKYVVCNGDEGDPGAFMDRMLLESYPFRVIEGMLVAGYAVGASEGILYIRAEYPLAIERVQCALAQCREAGLLGDDILGSGFAFNLRVMEGAGAFVCGEETALVASMEGKRGTPRLRPPYPAESGFRHCPTLVNNTETFSLVPWILRQGAEAFAAIGTARSKGTKVFALAGKVVRGGMIEVPMGTTIRQVVEDIGGGIADGHRLKAVQIGGPSGGCIPARLADIPIDYEALVEAGAMMGSGGLVVLDDTDCMVELARYFLDFTQHESCGKCTFCRIGTRRMLDILERLCAGGGSLADLDELEHLAAVVKRGSLCGLGKTAPNPVLTTLAYFRDEYEAHVNGCCPAGQCKALIRYAITENCIGCTRCARHCPADAIEPNPYRQHTIDTDACVRCDACRPLCPAGAVVVLSGGKNVKSHDHANFDH